MLLSQLHAAQAAIAEMHGLLGAARAELKAVDDARQAAQDTGTKLAVLEAKLEAKVSNLDTLMKKPTFPLYLNVV